MSSHIAVLSVPGLTTEPQRLHSECTVFRRARVDALKCTHSMRDVEQSADSDSSGRR